ncbi:GPP34 family phosphoprotein [Actinocatenispora sera]|uniref:GPP34 family phosphoprotein n=1 Tax=Actinocatenispora sera TaxID=390989 RepID=UPI0033C0A0B4
MSLPDDLPERVYLLAVDRGKRRLVARDRIGYALRGAALAQLLLAGALRDDSGRVELVGRGDAGGLAGLLRDEIAADARPRRWRHWVRAGARRARTEVRDRLVAARNITVTKDRALGLFPVERIDVTDVLPFQRYGSTIRGVAGGSALASRVDPSDAAAVAIAVAAEIGTVLNGGDRRRNTARIEARGAEIAPVVTAIRQCVRSDRAARASASG